MIGPKSRKGQNRVPHHSSARTETREKHKKLAEYRAKSACMVHKAVGDPEEVRKEGLEFFRALSPARQRANGNALKDDDGA